MAEQVATGGVKTFYYRGQDQPQLQDEDKRAIREAYARHDERKRKKKERRNLLLSILLIVLLLILVGVVVYTLNK